MLELRPICDNGGTSRPPQATDAMICSFECALRAARATGVPGNVCPNGGGGFSPRPARDWRDGNCLTDYPASGRAQRKPVDAAAHRRFAAPIAAVDPQHR